MLPPVPDLGEIRFQKSRDAGGVLNATTVLLRRNAREAFVGFLAIVGPVALAGGIASALYFRQIGDVFSDPERMANDPFAVFNGTYVGLIAFGILTGVVSMAAAGAYVRLYRAGEAGEITVSVLWDEAKELILPMLGLTLAIGAAFVGSALLNVVPCLGTIAWFALWIWAFPYVMVTMAARAVESPSLGEAWSRARTLVKGSWGFAFGAIFLAAVVFYILSFALSIPFYALSFFASASTVAEDPSGVFGMFGLFMAPVQILLSALYLLPLVAAYFVHGKLVEELEGTSLMDDLDALADTSVATRWDDAPTTTEPQSPEPPRSTPPASEPEPRDDDAPRGFRGGGFGDRDA